MTADQRIEDAIADPSRQFERPMDVLNDPSLDTQAKRAILESWKKDAELLSTAANENMGGGEPTVRILEEATLALEKLAETRGSVN
jgi:hypothetical protein